MKRFFPYIISVISCLILSGYVLSAETADKNAIEGVKRLNGAAAEIIFSDGARLTVDFYGNNIFRLFRDSEGGIVRAPEAEPEAVILMSDARAEGVSCDIAEEGNTIFLNTGSVSVSFDRESGLMKVSDRASGRTVLAEAAPARFGRDDVSIFLTMAEDEYFYGGGVQNGRFSHRGKKIMIENQNSWTDGGVASPAPFYWSTGGYGIMWHTFSKGAYDFGSAGKDMVSLTHDGKVLDIFVMVDESPADLLGDYYRLTGNPVLLPKFAHYEGHLNAYNRDYWKEDDKGVLFEDGKRYKESQKDNGGIKESLNGEKDNYQFSARAVVDRYEAHDMPLGWILPNDGYGAGYGQTETLDGNIGNLKSFGDYAREHGVEIGLWTQSDLHPKEGVEALLQRDIVKEVRDAGVRVLKTDVAWVGWGYSFGLNGIADVAGIMPYYGNEARPFIITLDGWAGTQRYAGVWTGDQTGGEWEYIRFHIPTYIGSGLSGQPNICSDMDGIFGGRNSIVNIRDFQWKTFSIMQLNMDGWGSNEKYPHALGEPAASINRMYLKMKSELLPYAYSYAKEAVTGLPVIRAMFLEYPDRYTYGTATRYQYMFGKDFLVAPVYQETSADKDGNDIRNGIYLPEGVWYDYFSGESYEGRCVLNSYEAPVWKLPVFVRQGAIIPMTRPNNNPDMIDRTERIYEVYPHGESYMVHYDDDGTTQAYLMGQSVQTLLECSQEGDRAKLTIYPAQGWYEGFEPVQSTEVRFNVTSRPDKVKVRYGKRTIRLAEASSEEEYLNGTDIYYYNPEPELNRFATEGSAFDSVSIKKNPQLCIKISPLDISGEATEISIDGFEFDRKGMTAVKKGALENPSINSGSVCSPYSLTPAWDSVENADYYEIVFDSLTYTNIRGTSLLFEDLQPETEYSFSIRAVNADGASKWTDFSLATEDNPLEYAIRGISGKCSADCQEGFEEYRLFDFAESGDMWHTKYQVNSIPYEMTIDLKGRNFVDRFEYLPRPDGGNGTILKGSVSYSIDGSSWTEAGDFEWERNGDTKTFVFDGKPEARYIRISVTGGVNGYGSGRELYVFKVPGTATLIPGDINKDGKIDENDLTSYMNYTGLRTVDSDFEYVSAGDINCNGLIDAYDISYVTTVLDEGAGEGKTEKLSGNIAAATNKERFEAGEEFTVTVAGEGMNSVNAFSMALPYDPETVEFVRVEPVMCSEMLNLTKDRLHSDGTKALYPTFSNIGMQKYVEGDGVLFKIVFRARKACRFVPEAEDVMIVDKNLDYLMIQ